MKSSHGMSYNIYRYRDQLNIWGILGQIQQMAAATDITDDHYLTVFTNNAYSYVVFKYSKWENISC